MNNIVSFSGGKDSTAMLLMMLERNIEIEHIVFCDTGMEFPEMYEHIGKVENYIGRSITRLKPEKDWYYYMFKHKKTRGKNKGHLGYGFPTPLGRWCTDRLKQRPFKTFVKNIENPVTYIGIAFDEQNRMKNNGEKYPLIDWGVAEKDALKFCREKGFDWGGLYDIFDRVSCWCCPLQNKKSLKSLHDNFPHLWEQLENMQKRSSNEFRHKYPVGYFTDKFKT